MARVEADEQNTKPSFEQRIRGIVKDDQGNHVEGAKITALQFKRVPQGAVSERRGKFDFRFSAGSKHPPSLMIVGPQQKQASFISSFDDRFTTKLLRVQLADYLQCKVNVVDHNAKPVKDARVCVMASYLSILRSKTDQQGNATFLIPPDAKVDWIYAKKSAVGFDYFENYKTYPSQERLPLPKNIQLTLNGVAISKVRVVDSKGGPIANAVTVPWTIKKKGKLADINLSGESDPGKTNADGLATLDWLPADMERRTSVLIRKDGYHCPKTPIFDVASKDELKAIVYAVAKVSGQVTLPDGKPAAGIALQGEGRGNTNHYFRGYAMTDEQGKYEMDIYPDQSTMISVTEDDWAAESQRNILLTEGKQKQNVNFKLQSGTLIEGVITYGSKRVPSEFDTATLIENSEGTSLVRWNRTDRHGRYRFRAGPGDYTLRLPNRREEIKITVTDQDAIVNDHHVARKDRGILQGKMVDGKGRGLEGCILQGSSIGGIGHAGFRAFGDEDGAFRTERWNDKMLLYARNPKLNLAGVMTITEETQQAKITLIPAATVVGSVEKPNGQPAVNQRVQVNLSRVGMDGQIRLFVQTNQQGMFSVPAVAVGSTVSTYIAVGNDWRAGNSVEVEKAEQVELKEFTIEKS